MVMRNTCFHPHNRPSFNGLSLSMCAVEMRCYTKKMNRIPDDSLHVSASASMQISIGVKTCFSMSQYSAHQFVISTHVAPDMT